MRTGGCKRSTQRDRVCILSLGRSGALKLRATPLASAVHTKLDRTKTALIYLLGRRMPNSTQKRHKNGANNHRNTAPKLLYRTNLA